MKFFFLLCALFILSNCSLNKNSEFWLENNIKSNENKDKLNKILIKSSNVMTLSIDEFELYLNDYAKKNNYPSIK